MKILVAAAIVSFALVAPTLAMPIASPAASEHSAVVQVHYNHYRGGGYRGHGHHYGWGSSYHHHHRY